MERLFLKFLTFSIIVLKLSFSMSIPKDLIKDFTSWKLFEVQITLPLFPLIGDIFKDNPEVFKLKSYSSPSWGFSMSSGMFRLLNSCWISFWSNSENIVLAGLTSHK